MSWKKYFKVADTGGQLSPISGSNQFGLPGYPRQQGMPGVAGSPGTGNDFARTSFQKMSDLAKIVEAIGSNSYRHIDVIKVDLLDSSRYFGQVLSSGFDSYVNARANRIKYLPGSLKYILHALL